jgi:energy-coupling factor transporter ATP-binding protein EcfA2
MSNPYSKGSIWRKWDLHVHSPASVLNNVLFEGTTEDEKWQNFYNKLKEIDDVSVIGITDYFSIDGYKKVIAESSITNFDLILPNVELRMLPVTESEKPINLHVIFNPSIVDDLDSKFFSSLEFTYKNEVYKCTKTDLVKLGRKYKNNNSLDESSAYKAGVEQFKVTTDGLRKVFQDKVLSDNSIIAVSNNSEDGNSGIQHSSLASTREEIYSMAKLIFSSNPSDKKYFLGQGTVDNEEEVKRKYGSLKACIHGSDSHDICGMCKPCSKRGESGHDCNATPSTCDMRFCWIKADPTFEGLRQLVYEPEQRVKIQEKNPKDEFKKPFLSKITVSQTKIFEKDTPAFDICNLDINSDLVTIIGGRGTGKSLLVESLAKTFNKSPEFNDRLAKINPIMPFKCELTKTDDSLMDFELQNENNLDYLHVHQEQVKKIVKDVDGLDSEIKKLIGISEPTGFVTEDEQTKKHIYSIFEISEWLEETDDQGNLINTKKYQEGLKNKYEGLISTITTKNNQDKIEKYRNNSSLINFIDEKLESFSSLKDEMGRVQDELNQQIVNVVNVSDIFPSSTELTKFVNDNSEKYQYDEDSNTLFALSPILDNEKKQLESIFQDDDAIDKVEQFFLKSQYLSSTITEVDLSKQSKEIKTFEASLKKNKKELEAENEKIKKSFLESGIKEDVSTLLEKVTQYQGAINKINIAIQNIEVQQRKLTDSFTAIFKLPQSFQDEWNKQKETIEAQWGKVKNGDENRSEIQNQLINKLLADINITAEIVFNESKFYDEIAECLSGNKFKANNGQAIKDKFKQVLGVKDLSSYIDLIQNKKIIDVNGSKVTLKEFISDGSCFVKGGSKSFVEKIYLGKHIKNYIKVTSKSTYKNKMPNELSVGLRGTFYVCLKLATDSFSTPFVFDQPEDDLDNDFIMKELVPIFKEIKKYRQVIVVTHNANLVVNADAEQIIVAKNENEHISYTSGSLEDETIRESVYNILEGGYDAFKKREQKYCFHNK